jgi:hypothetical protein
VLLFLSGEGGGVEACEWASSRPSRLRRPAGAHTRTHSHYSLLTLLTIHYSLLTTHTHAPAWPRSSRPCPRACGRSRRRRRTTPARPPRRPGWAATCGGGRAGWACGFGVWDEGCASEAAGRRGLKKKKAMQISWAARRERGAQAYGHGGTISGRPLAPALPRRLPHAPSVPPAVERGPYRLHAADASARIDGCTELIMVGSGPRSESTSWGAKKNRHARSLAKKKKKQGDGGARTVLRYGRAWVHGQGHC